MGLKAQPIMALPNNQSLSLKLGKALSTTQSHHAISVHLRELASEIFK